MRNGSTFEVTVLLRERGGSNRAGSGGGRLGGVF